jgi:ActR/RegA family two-component response regulator
MRERAVTYQPKLTSCAYVALIRQFDGNDPSNLRKLGKTGRNPMTAPEAVRPEAGDPTQSLAVACVRALMDRHGLPKYRQSAWLADAMGLSYSQAHRRMTGASPWSLEDLAKVAALFGESLAAVVAVTQPDSAVAGTMNLGATAMPCRIWLGEEANRSDAGPIVAVRTAAGWSAIPASEATQDSVYRIEKIEARPADATRKVIAILDDDEDLTNSICAHFEASGYDARPFYRIADLLASAMAQNYDGYVIDWIVGETSVLKLIASLRDKNAKSPIVVLTGQVIAGVVEEVDIAEAVKRYDLTFSEKPVRTSILEATLARALALSEAKGR